MYTPIYTQRRPRKLTSASTMALALALIMLVGAFVLAGRPASADTAGPASGEQNITPVLLGGNVTCASRGYDYELKVNQSPNGTFTDQNDNAGRILSGPLQVTIYNSDRLFFDWKDATFGVDEVLVKAGEGTDTFAYDVPGRGEATHDTRLHAPAKNDGTPREISHISFCYDLELKVEKTANTELTRTYDWTIDKSVGPDSWDLFKGDSGTSDYTVSVDKGEGVDSAWKVTGTIKVTAPVAATVNNVTDTVSPDIAADVDCPGTFPVNLSAGQSLDCTYTADLPDASTRTNTAQAISGTAGVKDGAGTAQVDFANAKIDKVNDSITVDDSYAGAGGPWTFSDDDFVEYSRTFSCDGDEGVNNNTATIRGLNKSDSAAVTVNCHKLAVSKDANTSYTKKYSWTIDKSADQSNLTLSVGQSFLVNYSVKVDATSENSDHAVAGKITIANHAPIPADLTSVTDVVSPGIAANVDCASLTVPANGTLVCDYDADLPDASARTNTATAELQNHDYDSSGAPTNSGTTSFSGSKNFDFTNATVTEIDESIDVGDSLQGGLGTVDAADAPKTLQYGRNVGPYNTCGDRTVENTASFTTNDTGATGQDSWTVNVNVPCGGCTLTIGYWKTHANPLSPRTNPDETLKVLASQGGTIWLGTPNGAKSVAVTSSNVVNLLKMEDASNGINKLYAQLLAAKLNIAHGASGSAVQSTIASADAFLAQYRASQWDNLNKQQRNQVLNWARALDQYNNGLTGPGHCSESTTA